MRLFLTHVVVGRAGTRRHQPSRFWKQKAARRFAMRAQLMFPVTL
jgi:hypothetical protein